MTELFVLADAFELKLRVGVVVVCAEKTASGWKGFEVDGMIRTHYTIGVETVAACATCFLKVAAGTMLARVPLL